MREIKKIIIHCSAGFRGDLAYITALHTAPKPEGNGWSYIGYHALIYNGYLTYEDWKAKTRQANKDGFIIDTGIGDSTPGIHCPGDNNDSLGICLIGMLSFTDHQFDSLSEWIKSKFELYGRLQIWGHCERPGGLTKTCPNFSMEAFRLYLKKDWMEKWIGH